MAPSTVQLIKEECFISASQEALLSSVPGWQDSNVAADFTPDELHSPAPEVRMAKSVSSSSAESAGVHHGDLESQEAAEWGSPDDSFSGAFESDRDQSPRRESFSKGLIGEQPNVGDNAPSSEAHNLKEDATDSCAKASDLGAPADVPLAGSSLSPPRTRTGGSKECQRCSPKVQSTDATEVSPVRRALILGSPVSTGSASSLSPDTVPGDRTTLFYPCQDRKFEIPEERQKKRRKLPQMFNPLQDPGVNVPSPSREVASASHFAIEADWGLNNHRLQEPAQCLQGPNGVSLSDSEQMSPWRVEETDNRKSLPTPRYAKFLVKPCKGSMEAGTPRQAAVDDTPCKTLLELADVRIGKKRQSDGYAENFEILRSVHQGRDSARNLAIIVSPLNKYLEGESSGPSHSRLNTTEAGSTAGGCRRLEGTANEATGKPVVVIDATLPKVVERGNEQEQAHLLAELSCRHAPSTEVNKLLLQSYEEGSEQMGSSFSFEARDAMLEFDTPDLFGQLGKDKPQSLELCTVATKPAETTAASCSDGNELQYAQICREGKTLQDETLSSVRRVTQRRWFSLKSVMDVVRHCSGDMTSSCDSSDLLSAALQSGVTLPLPFQRRFPFS